MFDRFIKRLEEELSKPLPGLDAQLKMSPPFRKHVQTNDLFKYDPKISCVLILFYFSEEKIKTVLILRPSYDGVHSGQVAFPGGKIEEGDTDLFYTAMREANEEIGIEMEKMKVIGRLTELYIPPSNFLVHPFIAYTGSVPVFKIDRTEVEKVIEVSIEELLNEENISIKKVRNGSGGETVLMEAPVLELSEGIIWGATAMMISELKEVLKKV